MKDAANIVKNTGQSHSSITKISLISSKYRNIYSSNIADFIKKNTNIVFNDRRRYIIEMSTLSELVRQAHPHANADQITARVAALRDLIDAPFEAETQNGLALPERARITYDRRNEDVALAGTGIVEFLRAEYGQWLDGSLTQRALSNLDPAAYRALMNLRTRLRSKGKDLPPDVSLPSLRETNDKAFGPLAGLVASTNLGPRETMRLASALLRRAAKANAI